MRQVDLEGKIEGGRTSVYRKVGIAGLSGS